MAAKVHCETNLHVAFSNKKAIRETRATLMLEDPLPHCAEMIKPLKDNQSCSTNMNCSDSTQERKEEYEEKGTREILKQTMLKQEEIFRGQVQELHRLYRVQKLLMIELKNKTIGTSKSASATAQTSPFIFHFGSECVQLEGKRNFWDPLNGFVTDKDKISHTPPICGKAKDQTLCPDFLGQSLQIGLNPKDTTAGSQDFYRLQPSNATCRTFDLEKPAEECMDDKAACPKEDTTLRIAAKNTTKEEKSLNFSLFFESDSDVQLTLGTGYVKGKGESNCQKTPPSLGLTFPEFVRKQTTECRAPIFSDELKLYSPTSVRPEATIQEKIRTLGVSQETNQEYKKNEDYRPEWQRFGIEEEKSRKERNFLDLQIGERSRQENLKQPPWFLQGLNLNRT